MPPKPGLAGIDAQFYDGNSGMPEKGWKFGGVSSVIALGFVAANFRSTVPSCLQNLLRMTVCWVISNNWCNLQLLFADFWSPTSCKSKPVKSSDGAGPWVSFHQGYRSTRHTMQGSTTTQWGGGSPAILTWGPGGYRSIRKNAQMVHRSNIMDLWGLQFRPTPVFPKLLQKLQTADPEDFHQITILIPISARLFSCERRCCTDEGSGPAELVSFGIFAAAHFCHTSNLRPSCGRMPPIFYTKIIEWTMYT